MTIISPSLLSANFYDLKSDIEQLNESEAKWLHYDVMDGHFVPNLTFGPDILKQIGKNTEKLLDVHIMVSNPLEVIDYFKDCPIYMMTFHYEATNDDTCLKAIEKLAIIMGTEGDGLPTQTIRDADYVIRIPMSHQVDSLNVAAAAAVAFWELARK